LTIKYYELFDDLAIPGRWHLGSVCAVDGFEPPLASGVHCSCDLLLVGVHHGRVELDFCLTSFGVPVASTILAAAIESIVGRDVQRIPLSIMGRDNFEVLNVLRVVPCLDESRTEFLKWTDKDHRADLAGQYRQVVNLRVKPEAIPGDAHILRIDGWRSALIVSEVLRQEMERVGARGATFTDAT